MPDQYIDEHTVAIPGPVGDITPKAREALDGSVKGRDEAERVYQAYHKLGGNGTGTELHRKIMALPAYVDLGGGDDGAT